jgi:hypothetical protein
MGLEQMVMLLSRLAAGSLAAFLAIILWSKTRDTAWMFIIIGIIVGYGEIVYITLKSFGVVHAELIVFKGVSLFEAVLAVLPVLFFSVAFIIMILRRSIR